MPTPARTSLTEIVAAGRIAIAEGGLEALTMERVAGAVRVRTPSLYKRVRSRRELVRLVVEDLIRDLSATLESAATTGGPRRDLRALARAFRGFARSNPQAFGLLFSAAPDDSGPDPALLADAIEPVMRTTSALAGPEHALEAARTLTAWITGFLRMELAGAFQLGGDVDEAFEYGLDRLVRAIDARP